MLKKDVDKLFVKEILPSICEQEKNFLDGLIDVPLRCEEYNNFIDYLEKDGQITEKQANTYCIPKKLIGE